MKLYKKNLWALMLVANSYAVADELGERSSFSSVKERELANVKKSDVSSSGLMSKAWGLNSTHGIAASKAWSKMNQDCSKSKVVVAVIDTGINANHPALKDSIWLNPKEKSGKAGADNDNNGFANDVSGWDFASNSGKIIDQHGHGTHIAGIIAANGDGVHYFKGVCPGVKIMSLRYYNPKGTGLDNLKNTVRAINYAVDNGATIINYSGGGAEYSKEEFEALKRAEDKGILVVAAAGNERSNADKNLYYPAAYALKNIISVTAINEKGEVLPSSNWGVEKVHLAAPGQNILSTDNTGGYTFMTGTSQATAFVTGVAALLMTEKPSLSFAEVKTTIETSAKKYPQLVGKTKTGAQADAFAAIEKILGSGKTSPSKKIPTRLPAKKTNRKLANQTQS